MPYLSRCLWLAKHHVEGNGDQSSVLAWETPLTEEPGGLQSKNGKRFGHDLVTKQQLTAYFFFLDLPLLSIVFLTSSFFFLHSFPSFPPSLSFFQKPDSERQPCILSKYVSSKIYTRHIIRKKKKKINVQSLPLGRPFNWDKPFNYFGW